MQHHYKFIGSYVKVINNKRGYNTHTYMTTHYPNVYNTKAFPNGKICKVADVLVVNQFKYAAIVINEDKTKVGLFDLDGLTPVDVTEVALCDGGVVKIINNVVHVGDNTKISRDDWQRIASILSPLSGR